LTRPTEKGAAVSPNGLENLAGTVCDLIEAASYRDTARQIADEVARLPTVADAVPILVDLSQT